MNSLNSPHSSHQVEAEAEAEAAADEAAAAAAAAAAAEEQRVVSLDQLTNTVRVHVVMCKRAASVDTPHCMSLTDTELCRRSPCAAPSDP